jgi:GT2 family glycosyltransferase
VSWNARRYVEECLQSLEAQDISRRLEIIVVDNASTDGSPAMIRQCFPKVTVVQNDQNVGFARANNIGIQRTTGRYIFLINSDVNVSPDCLRQVLEYMEQNRAVGLLGPRMLSPDGKTARSCMRFPTLWNSLCRALALDTLFSKSRWFGGFLMRDFEHDRTADVEVLNGWFWSVRREALERVGLLDERFFIYGEDIDWCRRFQQAGWRVVFYPHATALHYGGASSSNAPVRFSIEMERANLQYWKKHHGGAAWLTYAGILLLHHVLRVAGYVFIYALQRARRSQATFKIRKSLACARWLVSFQTYQTDQAR